MKPTRPRSSIRSAMMRAQALLVLPLIILILTGLLFFLNSFLSSEIAHARSTALHSAAGAFDSIYARSVKLLEIPYTEDHILTALTSEPIIPPQDMGPTQRNRGGEVFNALYMEVLYYEPSIAAVTLVSERSGRLFYSRQPPVRSINGRNPELTDLRGSAWYSTTVASDQPIVWPTADNELYVGAGLTMAVSQRLIDPNTGDPLGAIRIDVALSTLDQQWEQVATQSGDIFAVTDRAGNLVFASSPDFLSLHPLLTPWDSGLADADYAVSQATAPASGFTFHYLASPVGGFNMWILYGVPIGILLLCGAYAAFFIARSSRAISRPVTTLKAAMIEGQRHNLRTRCAPLDGEMGELAEAFNDLMEQMEALVAEVASTEQEKARLSYEVLQSKLNPHFLYNTMGAIRWKADLLGVREVSSALESLVSLLRFTIKTTSDTVSFAVELEQLENYITVMRVRYGTSIDIAFDIDDACMDYQCLKFLFQPIVENCFIHAFSRPDQPDKLITITARVGTDAIQVQVQDNGDGMTADLIDTSLATSADQNKALFASIGIDNVHQRIRSLFGPEFGLTIDSQVGHYTCVTATIPLIPRDSDTGCAKENPA